MKFAPNMAENSGARLGAPTVREGLAASTRSSASGHAAPLVAAGPRRGEKRFSQAELAGPDDLSGFLYSLVRENGIERWRRVWGGHRVARPRRRDPGPRVSRHGIDQVEHPAGCGPRAAGGGCGGRARARRESPGQQQREHRNDQNCGRAFHFVLHFIRRMTTQER